MAIYIIKPWYKQISSGGIYGAEWNGSSTTVWTRTDDAVGIANPNPAINNGTGSSPFDNIMPWKGMVKVSDSSAGELVAIPKFYFKLGYANPSSSTGLKIQISDQEFTGSQVSPAHMDRGDGNGERDVIYVGRYHCASDYKSKTGVTPLTNISRVSFRSYIHSLGSTIWQMDYATLLTIQLLYLVEFADWNSQVKIGYGCGNGSSIQVTGFTDSMQYHTGTNASSRSTYGHTQYRNIEDLWGNVFDWCDGIRFNGGSIYVIKNPASFAETGGVYVGNRPTSRGYITKYGISSVYNWFMYPSAIGGSDSTYISDFCDYNASNGTALYFGGVYAQYLAYGLFRLNGDFGGSYIYNTIGSRLMKLP